MTRKLAPLALVAVLAVPALAQNPPSSDSTTESGKIDRPCGPRGKGHGGLARMLERHGAELGIPAETVNAVRAIEEAARPELEALHSQMRQAREALANGQGDQAAVEAARKAMMDKRADIKAKVDALLTPEQRAALEEWKTSRGFRKGGPHGRGGRGANQPAQ